MAAGTSDAHPYESTGRTRRARTCCSTRTIRWTGIPGAMRRSHGPGTRTSPIFLSIGYSTCHWCHVMERESFEDEETARQLNRDFISIKVDREERPDIDETYMTAVQMMTGVGRLAAVGLPDARRASRSTAEPTSPRGPGSAGPVFARCSRASRRPGGRNEPTC